MAFLDDDYAMILVLYVGRVASGGSRVVHVGTLVPRGTTWEPPVGESMLDLRLFCSSTNIQPPSTPTYSYGSN